MTVKYLLVQVEAIFWGLINYMKFHAGDDTELCRANLYGRYWDIPGGDVKIPGGYQASVLSSMSRLGFFRLLS